MILELSDNDKTRNWFKSSLATEKYGAVDSTFQLESIHFHTPAEHLIAGKRYDLEMHLVHRAKAKADKESIGNTMAVIAFLFDVERYDKRITTNTNQTV